MTPGLKVMSDSAVYMLMLLPSQRCLLCIQAMQLSPEGRTFYACAETCISSFIITQGQDCTIVTSCKEAALAAGGSNESRGGMMALPCLMEA